ncbi:unnamed protein product [Bursaphelenchus xylophilus]|uniref:(pine wood nematode) hypothetical protein n=1 Tax=Bursaphelenchus xylophilus TaxID=6326 RepID=A0A1I7RSV4_BURXY|nr:unnamed protein product [Bursaphelenchus xylophilus]CAG9122790.1 unnamed protein product [Bursaphelenchus xylophilus]
MAPVVVERDYIRLDVPTPEYLPYEDSGPDTPSPKPDLIPLEYQNSLSSASISSTSPPVKEVPVKPANFTKLLKLFQSADQPKFNVRKMEPSETFSSDENDCCLMVTEKRLEQKHFKAFKAPVKTPSLLSLNVRDYGSSIYSPSFHSPRSIRNTQSPTNSIKSTASDMVFHQMAVSHSSTLAFVSNNYNKLLREHSFPNQIGVEIYERVSLSNIVFKSTTPTVIKDKILLFEAAFVSSSYHEYPITVMISSADTYAPLLGRHADRIFGPPLLAEFEEITKEMSQLLDEAGQELKQQSTLKVTVMPPMHVCSFPALAAHNLHKGVNPYKREEQTVFIMIQLLNALKCLQADGIELLSNNFKEFLLSYSNPDGRPFSQSLDQLPRLILLRSTVEEDCNEETVSPEPKVTLCKFALRALCTLLGLKIQNRLPEITEKSRWSSGLRKCSQLLNMERSSSLTDAQQTLEFCFFAQNQNFENDLQAKLWLDESRAKYVNQVVRWLVEKSRRMVDPKEKHYLLFLLGSTPMQLSRIAHTFKRK